MNACDSVKRHQGEFVVARDMTEPPLSRPFAFRNQILPIIGGTGGNCWMSGCSSLDRLIDMH